MRITTRWNGCYPLWFLYITSIVVVDVESFTKNHPIITTRAITRKYPFGILHQPQSHIPYGISSSFGTTTTTSTTRLSSSFPSFTTNNDSRLTHLSFNLDSSHQMNPIRQHRSERRPPSEAYRYIIHQLQLQNSTNDIQNTLIRIYNTYLWYKESNLENIHYNTSNSQGNNINIFNILGLHPKEQTYILQQLADRSALNSILYFLLYYSNQSNEVYTSSFIRALSRTSNPNKKTLLNYSHYKQWTQQMMNAGITPNSYTLTAIFHHLHTPKQVAAVYRDLQCTFFVSARTISVANAAIRAATKSYSRIKKRERPSQDDSMSSFHHPYLPNTNYDNEGFQTALYIYRTIRSSITKDGSEDRNTNCLRPNNTTYTLLFTACAHTNQLSVAMAIWDDMISLPSPPNAMVISAALTVCAKVGDYLQAQRILLHVPTTHGDSQIRCLTQRQVSAYLAALAKAGQWEKAWIVLEQLQSATPTTVIDIPVMIPTTTTTTSRSWDDGNHSSILRFHPIPVDIVMVNIVLYACSKAKRYDRAKELWNKLKSGQFLMSSSTPLVSQSRRNIPRTKTLTTTRSLQPDEITYNTLLSACNNSKEARVWIHEMRMSRRHRYGQTPPTAKTYTLAIAACQWDWDSAISLLRDAQQHDGIIPNTYMYTATIWIAAQCNKPDDALMLLNEMIHSKDCTNAIPPKADSLTSSISFSSSCKPNDVTYGGVITALANVGRAREAIQLFADMKQRKIPTNPKIFSRVTEAIAKAAAVLTQPQTQQPSDPDGIRNLQIMTALSLLESVVDLMDPEEFSCKLSGPILESIILHYAMSNRFDDALRIYHRIRGLTDGPCLRAILSACALVPDRWEIALRILNKAYGSSSSNLENVARNPQGILLMMDLRAVGFAIVSCSKSNQWFEAWKLLDSYGINYHHHHHVEKVNSIPRSAINSLIACCGRVGRPDMALKILYDMKPKYGVEPNEISYRSAVIACNQAQHDIRRRQEHGLETTSISSSSSTLQWWECSLSLLRRMKEEGLQPDVQTYSSVISACESAGQWQRALGILQREEGSEDKLNLYCYNAAMSACEKGGAWVEALELYYRMMDITSLRPNFVTLSSLLIALDTAGQKELAQDMYEQALQEKILRRPWVSTRSSSSSSSSGTNDDDSKDYFHEKDKTKHANNSDGYDKWIRALDFHNYSAAMTRTALQSVIESQINDIGNEQYSSNTDDKNCPSQPCVPPQEEQQQQQRQSSYRQRRSSQHDVSKDLVLIVGKGRGSRLDPVLGNTVEEFLRIKYNLNCMVDPNNSGRYIVKAEDLQALIRNYSPTGMY